VDSDSCHDAVSARTLDGEPHAGFGISRRPKLRYRNSPTVFAHRISG
jgi:hypothetical protein